MAGQLRGQVVSIRDLTPTDRAQMYGVFSAYYADTSREGFEHDLAAKDHTILLRDRSGRIRGFSTLRRLAIRHEGRTHYGIFSGDTVVDRPFWGTKVLGRTFLRHLFWERLRRPWAPLWWFLISKGYKTYLLMANNFSEHWPRHEQTTPAGRQALLDAFAGQVFPGHYQPDTGLITFPPSSGRLREGVAAATEALTAANPRIRYFVERNPDWARGVELACIAEMSWSMPLRYALKALRKRSARRAQLQRKAS